MIAFADVESAAISEDTFDDRWDQDVGIGISIAVRIGAEVVGH